MDHISCLQPIPNSKKSQVIQLKRNGDGQLTEILIYKELFSYINRFNEEPAFASIYVLYDLHSGIFWWRYYEEKYENDLKYKNDLKHEIDIHLNKVGYWEDEDTVYNYHNEARHSKYFNSKFYIFFSADNMAEFYVGTDLAYIGSQGRYETFEHAYEALISNIKENGTFLEPWNGKVVLWKYLDRHFFNVPYHCQSPIITKLIDVQYFENQWMIEIEGSDWREESPAKKARVTVVLNENYELVDILGEDYLKKKSMD